MLSGSAVVARPRPSYREGRLLREVLRPARTAQRRPRRPQRLLRGDGLELVKMRLCEPAQVARPAKARAPHLYRPAGAHRTQRRLFVDPDPRRDNLDIYRAVNKVAPDSTTERARARLSEHQAAPLAWTAQGDARPARGRLHGDDGPAEECGHRHGTEVAGLAELLELQRRPRATSGSSKWHE
jgi:hypothetical protein